MRTRATMLAAVLGVAGCLTVQAQTPVITGIVNNATQNAGNTPIAPGENVTINGTNLGDATFVGCGGGSGFPNTCGSVSVTIGGKTAPVHNEISNQLNIQVPVDLTGASAPVVVTRITGGQPFVSQPFTAAVAVTAPQIYFANGNGASACFNTSNNPVSAANAVLPGDLVRCLGNGFGVTNPVVPSGQVTPASPASAVVASVKVMVAGQNATVSSATLQGGQIGNDQVTFTVPQGIPGGNQPLIVTVGGVNAFTGQLPIAIVGPNVNTVVNAASGNLPGLPNSGIAQGAVFLVFGAQLGPSAISVATNPFQSASLSGTSMSVTVAGTTVSPLMYYTVAGQVAALLPSNTPTGTGTITVTYNGQTSLPAPITVVPSNVGILTVSQNGQGPGIVTYPDYSLVSATKAANCGGPNTMCGAANPGDTLSLWATGLGPVSGSDATGAGLGQNMPNLPLTLWLGGVQAPVVYQGRSGCCIGEDQIAFTVPNNVPTGCAVPLLIQIGDQISNNVVMPVASGSRDCTPSNAALATVNLEQAVTAGPIIISDIRLNRTSNPNGQGYADDVHFGFNKILTYVPGTQPFFVSYVDVQPLGTCLVSNSLNLKTEPPFLSAADEDAGSSFTVTGPNGSKVLPGSPGDSDVTISAAGTYFSPGTYTVTGTGGADVGGFNAVLNVSAAPALTSPANSTIQPVTRSNGMTITWTGGAGDTEVQIQVSGAIDNTHTTGATATCRAPASAGTFTIPPSALLALPAGSFGGFSFAPRTLEVPFTASGLTVGELRANYASTFISFTLK